MDFQERQKQIYELSSFISEQEKWLEGVLGKLRWTKEYLSSVRDIKKFTSIGDPLPIPLSSRIRLTWSNVLTTPVTMFPAPHWRATRSGAGTVAWGSRWTGRLSIHWHPQAPFMTHPISLTYTLVCHTFVS